jgi:hypothetical protein
MARGLRELLNMLAEEDGTLIRDADEPELALVMALAPKPAEHELVRAAVALLVREGFLGSDGRSVWIPELPASQAFGDIRRAEPLLASDTQRPATTQQRASSTERVRRHRAKKQAALVADAFPEAVIPNVSAPDGVSSAVSSSVSGSVSVRVSASRGDREQDPSRVTNREKHTEKDLLPPQRVRELARVSPVSSSVSVHAVSQLDGSDEEDDDDSFQARSELPTDLAAALALPIHARAALVVEKPELARRVHPEQWPEVRSVADALAEASGLRGGYLGSYEDFGATSREGRGATTTTPTSDPPGPGVEVYSYDPTLCVHEQAGLDRLRCIADREMAAVLYNIYVLVERNRARARPTPAAPHEGAIGLRVLATSALDGEFGYAARELASNLLIDEHGREIADERALKEFWRAFRKLPRGR